MKFSSAAVFLSLAFSVNAQPSPPYNGENLKFSEFNQLCQDTLMHRGLRQVVPSDTNEDGYVGPFRMIKGNWYTTDRPHYVIGSPNEGPSSDYLNIFLHGTSSSPYRHTCILDGVSSGGTPTIGLSYASLNAVDSQRNIFCSTESDTAQCLTDNHIQAIEGGDLRPHLWDSTDPRDSIKGRIERLVMYLHKTYPMEGWDRFCEEDGEPIWSKMVVMGHSQGSGHAGYLAQMDKLAGAGLLSGPQDECIGCAPDTHLWVDDPFKTYAITAMAGADASDIFEPALPSMIDNWQRMADTGTISWSGDITPLNIGFGVEGHYDVCNNPIVSSLEAAGPSTSGGPGMGTQCGRAGHCSIAVDDSVPVLQRINASDCPVFKLHAWPEIADAPKCNNKYFTKKGKKGTKGGKSSKTSAKPN